MATVIPGSAVPAVPRRRVPSLRLRVAAAENSEGPYPSRTVTPNFDSKRVVASTDIGAAPLRTNRREEVSTVRLFVASRAE